MTEREVLLTGIGGQGVQLAAQVLARGAVLNGRHVLLFGVYGGAMRGMNTDGTVIVGDAPIQSPPVLSHAWSAIAMHDRYWGPVAPKLRKAGVVVVNDSTFGVDLDDVPARTFRVRASELAAEVGDELAAAMVIVGAYAGLTGLVTLAALHAGMRESVPAYRRQHLEINEAALTAGFDAVERLAAPAWDAEPVRT
jgi:Pyruvate/2-oxoacid:ferredoxin oxidoreductase gamma subunit